MGRIYVSFPVHASKFGGVTHVNHQISKSLERNFETVDRRDRADLQVCSLDWEAPTPPRRVFIDHGSFADAGFWAYTAPKLRSDDTILVSSRVCERIADRLFGPSRPGLVRVPLFADTSLFQPAEDRSALRDMIAANGLIPADGPLLLAVSTYARRKNLHLAVQLFAEVCRHVPRTRLAIVGPASETQREYEQDVTDLVRELSLEDRVHRIPVVPSTTLRDLMASADALLHLTTCRIENFGLVVAEALASGLPVIGADWGGLRDLVEHGTTGYLGRTWLTMRGPRVDWRGLVPGVVGLLTDTRLHDSMSRRAVEFAQSNVSPAVFERRLCHAIQGVLDAEVRRGEPVSLSDVGQDLMFATIQLHMNRPGIRSTSEEYRALLEVEPELCRVLTGPAASTEDPPEVTGNLRVYRVVSSREEHGALRVTDPAWHRLVELDEQQRMLAAAADGRSLDELAAALGLSRASIASSAQVLFDEGVLGPLVD